jgi:hypothetical protein
MRLLKRLLSIRCRSSCGFNGVPTNRIDRHSIQNDRACAHEARSARGALRGVNRVASGGLRPQLRILAGIRSLCMFSLSVVYTWGLAGCGAFHNSAISGPDTPKVLKVNHKVNLSLMTEVINFYYNRCLQNTTVVPAAPLGTPDPNCGTRQEQRNTIIYDLKRIIDHNYDEYARHFQQTADITTFTGEVAAASLTAVGTLVGATELKDILTTASTLTQSTNVSIQKNFYQKQTEYAILAQMDADRATQWSTIVQRMDDNLTDYPLSAALDDLQQYKRAGTATAALTAITQKAGAEKGAADKTINDTLGVK